MKNIIQILLLAFSSFLFIQCGQHNYYANYTISDLKSGKYERDTSFIYDLPYEKGKSYLIVQGYQSKFLSHKGEYSLDFKMKIGTKICAARDGIVVRMEESYTEGGVKAALENEANYVVIKHEDNTYAGYWHLQFEGALVEIGDTVKAGDVIALSGDTGYSAFPHLHFWIYTYEGGFKTMPTRFRTSKGDLYLRPGKRYIF